MKLCKKLLSLLLVLTVLAGFLVPAAADTADFNAGLTINRDTAGQITVTVIHSDVLVSEVPTLSVPCDFAYATVTFNGKTIASTLSDGKISFPVAAGGDYLIKKTDAPAASGGITGTVGGSSGGKQEVVPWVNPYSDVKASDWYYEAVETVSRAGLMNGTGAGFSPKAPMQRNMLMTILARMDGVDTTTGATWDAVGMAWSVANGISDGSAPSRSISRQEIVVMLYRYAMMRNWDCSARADLSAYPDRSSVAAWASDAIRWAVSTGILTGRTDGTLDPTGTATRAEVAALIARFVSWAA